MMLRRVAVSFVVCWGSVFCVAAAVAQSEPGSQPYHHGSHKPSTSTTDAQKAEHAKELAARKAHFEAERARREHLRELAAKTGDGSLTPHQRDEAREARLKHLLAEAEAKNGGNVGRNNVTLSPHELAELHEKWAKHRRELDERRAAMERLLGLMDGKPSGNSSKPTVSGVSVSNGPGSSSSGSSGPGSGSPGSDSSGSDSSASSGPASDTTDGSAQSGGPTLSKEQEAELRHEYHWLLEHFDANGDGRLDRAEIEHAREALRRHTEGKESDARPHSHNGDHASAHTTTASTTNSTTK